MIGGSQQLGKNCVKQYADRIERMAVHPPLKLQTSCLIPDCGTGGGPETRRSPSPLDHSGERGDGVCVLSFCITWTVSDVGPQIAAPGWLCR